MGGWDEGPLRNLAASEDLQKTLELQPPPPPPPHRKTHTLGPGYQLKPSKGPILSRCFEDRAAA